jgi:hypothetical protein
MDQRRRVGASNPGEGRGASSFPPAGIAVVSTKEGTLENITDIKERLYSNIIPSPGSQGRAAKPGSLWK